MAPKKPKSKDAVLDMEIVEIPEAFQCARLCGNLLEFSAIALLVFDSTSYFFMGHEYSLSLAFWAAIAVVVAAITNFCAVQCFSELPASIRKAARVATTMDVVSFINLVALDGCVRTLAFPTMSSARPWYIPHSGRPLPPIPQPPSVLFGALLDVLLDVLLSSHSLDCVTDGLCAPPTHQIHVRGGGV